MYIFAHETERTIPAHFWHDNWLPFVVILLATLSATLLVVKILAKPIKK